MADRPDDPRDFIAFQNKTLERLRAVERQVLRLPDGADPLQTFENGSPLGDTRFLDFGGGLTAKLIGDDFVRVEGGASGGSRWGTVVVAASDTHQTGKDSADFVCTGTSDEVTLAAALATFTSLGGEMVLLEGTYQLAAVWLLNKANVRIRGMGPGTILRVDSGFVGTEPLRVSVAKVHITACKFVDATPKTKRAIELTTGCDDCWITECYFDAWDFAVKGSGSAGTRIRLVNNVLTGCDDGLDLPVSGASQAEVWGNAITGCTGFSIRTLGNETRIIANRINTSTGYGIECQSGQALIAHNNVGSGSSIGIYAQTNDTLIVGNWVEDCTEGILMGTGKMAATGNTVQNCSSNGIRAISIDQVISGNRIDNCLRGINLDCSNAMVSGNLVQFCLQEGIYLEGSSNRARNSVVGNFVLSCSQSTNNTYDGIYVGSDIDECNIQANIVRHGGETNKHRYGINIADSTSDNNLVTNNDLLNSAVTGSLNNAGTGTITAAGNRL